MNGFEDLCPTKRGRTAIGRGDDRRVARQRLRQIGRRFADELGLNGHLGIAFAAGTAQVDDSNNSPILSRAAARKQAPAW
jgi:hypothetical protein